MLANNFIELSVSALDLIFTLLMLVLGWARDVGLTLRTHLKVRDLFLLADWETSRLRIQLECVFVGMVETCIDFIFALALNVQHEVSFRFIVRLVYLGAWDLLCGSSQERHWYIVVLEAELFGVA